MTGVGGGVYEALKKLFVTDKDGHITIDDLTKWGGTALTGRDISGDLSKLDVALSTLGRLQPWYQPNYAQAGISYEAAGVAPHGVTTRSTYTVPANRRAMVVSALSNVMRDGAPTTAGTVEVKVVGGTSKRINTCIELTATVGISLTSAVGWGPTLVAADVLYVKTSDASTNGTYNLIAAVNFMVFDT